MTLVIAVLAILVVLVLTGWLLRMRREMQSLSQQVAGLHETLSTRDHSAEAAPTALSSPPAAVLPVPVITNLTDVRPDQPHVSPRRVVSVTLALPLIKIVALAAGLHRALDDEHRMRVSYAFRRELKRQRKLRRRATAARARQSAGWVP